MSTRSKKPERDSDDPEEDAPKSRTRPKLSPKEQKEKLTKQVNDIEQKISIQKDKLEALQARKTLLVQRLNRIN